MSRPIRSRSRASRLYTALQTEVCTCYEAGYDGFWLHRVLESQGMRNSVLDSASIQVSRGRRRLKKDQTDAGSLIRVFMAWQRGEHQACSIVRVPTPEEEDMKRLHRSRANLLRDRVRHHSSGSTSREQGISKMGNNRVRHNGIELA